MNESNPLVTVISSCYNHEPYLDDYFQGLLEQTYDNVELIFFDDSSTDRSWDKALGYESRLKKKFTRVILERHPNMGPYKEFTQAIRRGTGDYLCFLDSDDYYLPTKLDENVRLLKAHPEVGLVYSDNEHVRDGRVTRYKNRRDGSNPSGDVLDDLLEHNFISTCTACCRMEFAKRHGNMEDYQARGYIAGDYPIWLRIAREAKVGYIPQVLARYRVLPESFSRSRSPHKRYTFAKSLDLVKLDFIDEYAVTSPVVKKVLKDHHITLFYGGYTLRLKEDCIKGYEWLARNYPDEFQTRKQALRMRLVNQPWLWKIVRSIEDWPPVRGMLGANEIAP